VSASISVGKRAEVAAILQAFDTLKAEPCASVCIWRTKRRLCPLSALVAVEHFGADFEAFNTAIKAVKDSDLYSWFAERTGFAAGYVSGFMFGFDGGDRAKYQPKMGEVEGYMDGLFVRVALSAVSRTVHVPTPAQLAKAK